METQLSELSIEEGEKPNTIRQIKILNSQSQLPLKIHINLPQLISAQQLKAKQQQAKKIKTQVQHKVCFLDHPLNQVANNLFTHKIAEDFTFESSTSFVACLDENQLRKKQKLLKIDLTQRCFSQKSLTDVLNEASRLKSRKISAESQANEFEQKHHVVFLMLAPTQRELMKLIEVYNLNPLILMEMQHSSSKFSHASAFVNPRMNKQLTTQTAQNEAVFINLVLRDNNNVDRMVQIRMIHALRHKLLFLFFQDQILFDEYSAQVIEIFQLECLDNCSYISYYCTETFQQKLECSDFIFSVLSLSLNRTERIVYNLSREQKSYAKDITKRHFKERLETCYRVFRTKQDTIYLIEEIQNKLLLLDQLQKIMSNHSDVQFELAIKLRIIEQRLNQQKRMLEKAKAKINFELSQFGRQINNELRLSQYDTRKVQGIQSLLLYSFIPIIATCGLFSINVTVPWQDATSLVPWFCILAITIAIPLILIAFIKYKDFPDSVRWNSK